MNIYDVVSSMAVRLLYLYMFDRCNANQTEIKLRLVHNKWSLKASEIISLGLKSTLDIDNDVRRRIEIA